VCVCVCVWCVCAVCIYVITEVFVKYPGDQTKKNAVSGACSTYGGQERCIQGFGGGDLMEKDHLEDLAVDGRIILKVIFNNWDVEVWTGWSWLRLGTYSGLLVS